MIDLSHFDSLVSLVTYFDSEEKCRQTLAEQRWGEPPVCPHCGSHRVSARKDGRYLCNHCRKTFSVISGTVFESTKMPLRKWFLAMYLIAAHKKGISSVQLSSDLGITQKTAWHILHKVRHLMGQDDGKLFGEVEMDEMYYGGKESNKHESKKVKGTQGRSTKTKTPVFGMVQRKGNLKAVAVPGTKSETLLGIVKEYVTKGCKVYTDELSAYKRLTDEGYGHDFVRHHEKEYVSGSVFTNTIEGFWSQMSRMLYGTHHAVSRKHLQRYVDEEVFRWNSCERSTGWLFSWMFDRCSGRFTYKDVTLAA